MKIGSHPTLLHERTGEFTPPGKSAFARANAAADFSCRGTAGVDGGRWAVLMGRKV
jgi:hypothetical protein